MFDMSAKEKRERQETTQSNIILFAIGIIIGALIFTLIPDSAIVFITT